MRTACVMVAVAFGLSGVSAAPVPKDAKKKTVQDKVLGKWKLVASQGGPTPNSAFRIVFKKDGELEFRREYPGQPADVSPGKYKTAEPNDEHKLGTIDWTVKEAGSERGEMSRITELTDDVLEFKDPDGLVERFERVKEEDKKDEKKDK